MKLHHHLLALPCIQTPLESLRQGELLDTILKALVPHKSVEVSVDWFRDFKTDQSGGRTKDEFKDGAYCCYCASCDTRFPMGGGC